MVLRIFAMQNEHLNRSRVPSIGLQFCLLRLLRINPIFSQLATRSVINKTLIRSRFSTQRSKTSNRAAREHPFISAWIFIRYILTTLLPATKARKRENAVRAFCRMLSNHKISNLKSIFQFVCDRTRRQSESNKSCNTHIVSFHQHYTRSLTLSPILCVGREIHSNGISRRDVFVMSNLATQYTFALFNAICEYFDTL